MEANMKHLSDEDIARLIDGKTGKKERAAFLKHISDCEDCLTIYTETLEFIEAEKQEPTAATFPGPLEILSRIKQPVSSIFPGKKWILVPALAILLIVFLLIIVPVILKQPARTDSAWWLKKYGDYAAAYAAEDPRVKQAFAVFERVSNAADKTGDSQPRLVIIDNKDTAHALAMRDNSVVIDLPILDVCYKGNDGEEGDTRLAIIFGHELAHLGDRDFRSMEMVRAFQDYGHEQDPGKFLKDTPLPGGEKNRADYFKKKEFEADKRGVIYARMAGFDVRKLFTGSSDFFKHWSKLTRIDYERDQVEHPAPGKRARLIREELAELAGNAQLFHAGVLLFLSGAYSDALAVFQAFAEIYPAREVYNNIGVNYLHQAMARIYQDFSADYFRVRLAVVIDYSTTADAGQTRSSGDYLTDPDISRYLKMAETYFNKAAQRDTLDNACRLNLAAVCIWRQAYARALEVCDYILAKNPRDARALNNKAVALYYQAKQKNRAAAGKLLEKSLASNPAHYESLYNLALIAEESGQDRQAKIRWQEYLHLEYTPKDQYHRFVAGKLKNETHRQPPIPAGFPGIPLNIGIGDNVQSIAEQFGNRAVKIYEAEIGGDAALKIRLQVLAVADLRIIVLDDRVSIVEQEFSKSEDSKVIKKYLGPPGNIIHHINGNFYIYSNENRGFAVKEISGAVHAYTWF